MTNNENNLGMSESGVNQSPLPDESAGSVAGAAGDGDELTAQLIDELKGKAAKADENWDKYVRTVADFDNYKKRAARERTDAIKYANEGLIEKLLPIVDNFEAALTAASSPQGGSVDSLKTGIQMIFNQMKSFLGEAGVEEIDAIGKQFDPNLHEAVSQQATED